MMGVPISIRLDDHVRTELEAQAQSRGIGLATLIRDLATEAAKRGRRERIRAESDKLASHLATTAPGQTFYADWGSAGGGQG